MDLLDLTIIFYDDVNEKDKDMEKVADNTALLLEDEAGEGYKELLTECGEVYIYWLATDINDNQVIADVIVRTKHANSTT